MSGRLQRAAVASGAVVPYEHREPLREYVVRENRPSYRHEREDEVVVGREMPRGAYESHDAPERYERKTNTSLTTKSNSRRAC